MKSILIIEDDDLLKDMLKQTFQRAGFDVATASNGRIGLKLHQANCYDLIITDLIMPEMEGIETISRLRDNESGTKIIAISGGGRCSPDDYLRIAKKLGADETFCKPIDRKKLLETVNRLLA